MKMPPRLFSAALLLGLAGCAAATSPPQQFDTPADAVAALEEAVAARSREKAAAIFGAEGDYLLESGDPALDTARAERFAALFSEKHILEGAGEEGFIVVIGERGWPFPVPIRRVDGGWAFDASAGREEILNRRIGENEFAALGALRTIYQAQRRFAAVTARTSGTRRYAERLISTPGERDGLYWPSEDPVDDPSPLGPAIARAADEPFVITASGAPDPFHGYLYRIVPRSADALAAPDALSAPGRYWLIAVPVRPGETGAATFAANERGWIFEKHIDASDSEKLARDEPAASWRRIE